MSALPYRQGVGVMLMNSQKKVFVAKRLDTTSEAWQMPQGGIDAGESPEIAVMRELGEEIGTTKATIIKRAPKLYTYDLPEAVRPKIWGGKYRGQEQVWFLMRFDGTDADINIDTHEPEFCEWKWVQAHTLVDLIVPFKRTLYAALVAEFSPYFA